MEELKDILFVEDYPDIQSIGKLALESIGGYTVQVCENGMEALAALAVGQHQLVLLDVMMPGMDGPTTLRAIRDLPNGKTIPVIFMTAKVQKPEVDAYLGMGALGVIAKPFDVMTLADSIRALWNEHWLKAG